MPVTSKIIGPDSFNPSRLPLRQLEKPQGDVCHLWHLDFNRLSNPLGGDPDTRFTDLSVIQQRATRRFFLRLLLGAYLGIPGKDVNIARGNKGRPELDLAQPDVGLDFSVARSNAHYLVGVSGGATIGVDLEVAKRRAGKPLALARRYFSDAETEALSRLDEEQLHRSFMYTWACKEAIVKASGVGIANQLCRFTVDVNPANPPSVRHMMDDDHEAWKLAIAEPVRGAIASIAVRQQTVQLKGYSLA